LLIVDLLREEGRPMEVSFIVTSPFAALPEALAGARIFTCFAETESCRTKRGLKLVLGIIKSYLDLY